MNGSWPALEHPDEDYVESFLVNTEKNIGSVLRNNSRAAFEQAIELLLGSRRKFILGTRANSGVSSYFLLLMKHMLPDVYSASAPGISVIDQLCDISAGDCLILFSFPRYSELDRQALLLAGDAGASILAITDKPSAPSCPVCRRAFDGRCRYKFLFQLIRRRSAGNGNPLRRNQSESGQFQ